MGTISEKLAYLVATKTAITDALTERGIDVAGSTFRQLAGKVLELTHPQTGLKLVPRYQFPEGSESAVCDLKANDEGAEIAINYPAPAPDIVLTPDAVGANPVTWYYRAVWGNVGQNTEPISLQSEERTFVAGDDTTMIVVESETSPPSWINYWQIMLGKASDNFDRYSPRASLGGGVIGLYQYVDKNTIGAAWSPAWIVDKPTYQQGYQESIQAPAPTDISITPDQAAVNPVTWYYKVIQLNASFQVCELSAEQSYVHGDDTTALIFDCTHVDRADTDLFLIVKGTTSGVYTNMFAASFTPPTTIVPIADVQLPYDLLGGVDVPAGAEQIAEVLSVSAPLLIYIYDNELFDLDGDELKFIAPPDYAAPGDQDGDNVYNVLVKVSNEDEEVEQVIEVEVTESP
jgi:hypothetical protein